MSYVYSQNPSDTQVKKRGVGSKDNNIGKRRARKPYMRINFHEEFALSLARCLERDAKAALDFIRAKGGEPVMVETEPGSGAFEPASRSKAYAVLIENSTGSCLWPVYTDDQPSVRRIAQAAFDRCRRGFVKLRTPEVRAAFNAMPAWKRKFLNGVGKSNVGTGPDLFRQNTFSALTRELRANDHKYGGITEADLTLAWEYNTGVAPH
jgi:hypothetical protein